MIYAASQEVSSLFQKGVKLGLGQSALRASLYYWNRLPVRVRAVGARGRSSDRCYICARPSTRHFQSSPLYDGAALANRISLTRPMARRERLPKMLRDMLVGNCWARRCLQVTLHVLQIVRDAIAARLVVKAFTRQPKRRHGVP